MLSALRPAIVSTVLFTGLLGVAYPLGITAAARVIAPDQAAGSLVRDKAGHVIGSTLIAQAFTRPEYLHPRPSAAGKDGYDTTSSGGSNNGPLSPDLLKREKDAADALRKEDGPGPIPADAVTTSASGLDPDVSPANAHFQVARIAAARGASPAAIQRLIDRNAEGQSLGFIGQPRVNVLKVNLALDAEFPKPPAVAAASAPSSAVPAAAK
jgi:K+-transporting ATPase ATPase C chain